MVFVLFWDLDLARDLKKKQKTKIYTRELLDFGDGGFLGEYVNVVVYKK